MHGGLRSQSDWCVGWGGMGFASRRAGALMFQPLELHARLLDEMKTRCASIRLILLWLWVVSRTRKRDAGRSEPHGSPLAAARLRSRVVANQ